MIIPPFYFISFIDNAGQEDLDTNDVHHMLKGPKARNILFRGVPLLKIAFATQAVAF